MEKKIYKKKGINIFDLAKLIKKNDNEIILIDMSCIDIDGNDHPINADIKIRSFKKCLKNIKKFQNTYEKLDGDYDLHSYYIDGIFYISYTSLSGIYHYHVDKNYIGLTKNQIILIHEKFPKIDWRGRDDLQDLII